MDITDTKLLQEEVRNQRDRLEGLLESEAAGYWDWNIPEHTEYMSPRFKEMFGYREDEIEDTPDAWQEMIHSDDLPEVLRNFEEHVKSKGAVPYDNEVRYHHKDGSIVWVLCRGRVVEWTDDWQPVRMMGVHLDITHLKEREEAVREDEVKRRAEEVKRFAFIAAHDLLQPVITIESSVDLLLKKLPDIEDDADLNAVREYLQNATARLRARIKGVLAYSRLQEDGLEFEPLDLREIVEDCVSDLESWISEAGASIEVSDLPIASGARSLIEQVVQNVLSNAIKYRREGVPPRVVVEPVKSAKGKVSIRIADNGIGIEPKHRQKVFDLFSRLHTDEEFAGEGIGLALCERIVGLHGGKITIEDGIDGGSAFVITLDAQDE